MFRVYICLYYVKQACSFQTRLEVNPVCRIVVCKPLCPQYPGLKTKTHSTVCRLCSCVVLYKTGGAPKRHLFPSPEAILVLWITCCGDPVRTSGFFASKVWTGTCRAELCWHWKLYMILLVEGSSEFKLWTIWTDEKQRWEESEKRREEEERRSKKRKSDERRCRCAKRSESRETPRFF